MSPARPHRGHCPAPDRLPAKTDRFAKTIVFCVDQEHADEMRRALNNLNADLVRAAPGLRVPGHSDEGDIGRGHLSKFQDVERQHAGHPDHLADAHHRRGRADLQEHRAGAGHQLHDRVQADHRPRHPRPRRLRQAVLQHPRLHRLRHAAVCRPRLRRRPVHRDRAGDRREGEPTGEETVSTPEEPEEPEADDGRRTLPPDEEPTANAASSTSTAARSRLPPTWSTNSTPTASQLRVVQFTDYTAEKVRTLYRNAAELARRVGRPGRRARHHREAGRTRHRLR